MTGVPWRSLKLRMTDEPYPYAWYNPLSIRRVMLIPDPYPANPACWVPWDWTDRGAHRLGTWQWGNRACTIGCCCGLAWRFPPGNRFAQEALDRARRHVRSLRSRAVADLRVRGRSLAGPTRRSRRGASLERSNGYSGRGSDLTGEVRPPGATPKERSGAGSTPAGSPLSELKQLLLVYHRQMPVGSSLAAEFLFGGHIEPKILRECARQADAHGDPMGANLAERIMWLTVRQRRKLSYWWRM